MFIHCFSPPLGRFRKQNWQDLVTDDRFSQSQACRSPGREVIRRHRGVVNMGGGKPVLSLRKSQTSLKATGWQEELHTTLILNDHMQGWELENSELGVGPLATSDWVQVYALSPPPAPYILSYMRLRGGLSYGFFIHLTALHPPQHFCTEWILNLFMQVLGSLWRKSRSVYFWSSRRKKQKTTQQSDTAWIHLEAGTRWPLGHFHFLMLRLIKGAAKAECSGNTGRFTVPACCPLSRPTPAHPFEWWRKNRTNPNTRQFK